MPELPEVEVICRTLSPHLTGRRVSAVEVRQPALRRPVDVAALQRQVAGHRITGLARRAKYLLLHLDSAAVLVVHLGMSGRLTLTPRRAPPVLHEHVVFQLAQSRGRGAEELRYRDPRRFGLIDLLPAATWSQAAHFRHLGPEPLDPELDADYFVQLSRRRRTPIKNFLMDARVVVGIGNIYAAEALHIAGIDPRTAAGKIGHRRWERLLAAAQQVLRQSIKNGGTSLVDYRDGEGQRGLHQIQLAVYGRTGEPCRSCGRRIRRLVQGGRSTFFCGGCQR